MLAPPQPARVPLAWAAPIGASVQVHQEYSPASAQLETNALITLVHLQGDEAWDSAQNALPVITPTLHLDT
jgi:hypothetical protein